ncbi:MAG: ester cyclase [Chloroflexota bacterium]
MSEAAEKLLDGILDAWNSKNVEKLTEYHLESWINHSAPDGMNDLASLQGMFALFTSAFPDLEMAIPKSIVDGDQVSYMYTISGTHTGDFMGIPASGKEINFQGMTMLNMDAGRCTEAWGVLDMMGLMQQIGAIPA